MTVFNEALAVFCIFDGSGWYPAQAGSDRSASLRELAPRKAAGQPKLGRSGLLERSAHGAGEAQPGSNALEAVWRPARSFRQQRWTSWRCRGLRPRGEAAAGPQRCPARGRGRGSSGRGVTCSWCSAVPFCPGLDGQRSPAPPQPTSLSAAAPALLGRMGAGPGPYGLTYREGLALHIRRVLLQELLLARPPRAVPSPAAPMLTPGSPSQMASRRLASGPLIKEPLFSKPFHSLFFWQWDGAA